MAMNMSFHQSMDTSNLSKHFIPTGKTIKSGFVTMPIYKFIESTASRAKE
jgi:hypothetical protein